MNLKEKRLLSIQRFITLSIIALLGLALAFKVPYMFPPSVRTISASYDYGFNNTIGILLLIAFSAIFVLLGFYWDKKEKNHIFSDIKTESKPITHNDVSLTAAISLLLIFFIFTVSANMGLGESQQFFFAMERISVGQKPYTDFDFYYGPLLAYVPYAIYKLCHSSTFDYKTAYFISLGIFQVAGLLQLRYILNSIVQDTKLARNIFYAVALSTLPLHSGINLIIFRFITPVAGLIFIRNNENKNTALRSAIIACLSFLTFGISAEYGVIFSITLCCYFLSSLLTDKHQEILPDLASTIISPAIFYLLFPGLFNTMHLYLLGAWRWPFVPSLVLVLFFVSIFIVAFFIGSLLGNIPKNRFFLSLCLLSIGSLPAALGRCDPGHILLNGLMVFVFSYIYISASSRSKTVAIISLLLILQFGVLYNLSTIQVYSRTYLSLAFKKLNQVIPSQGIHTLIDLGSRMTGAPKEVINSKIQEFNKSKTRDYNLAFHGISKISAPYPLPDSMYRPLQEKNKIEFLYFKDFSILASDPEVNFSIEDLKKKKPEFLILPIMWDKAAEKDDYTGTINSIFHTRYSAVPQRNGRALLTPLIEYIKCNFSYQDQIDNFVIMKRSPAH